MSFEIAIKELLKVEGGYVNHKNDRGGETNFGITQKTARKFGYIGNMIDMTADQAKSIYKKGYWDSLNLDKVSAVSSPIAYELFDTGVNMGIRISGEFLQRALNVISRKKSLAVDGIVGRKTLMRLRTVNLKTLLKVLNTLQGMRYIKLCEKDETQKDFVNGWFTRVY